MCLCTTEAAPLYFVSVATPVGLGTYLIDWVPDPVDWVADPVG